MVGSDRPLEAATAPLLSVEDSALGGATGPFLPAEGGVSLEGLPPSAGAVLPTAGEISLLPPSLASLPSAAAWGDGV